jgi:hypothetical protein
VNELAELLDANLGAGLEGLELESPTLDVEGFVAPGIGRTESVTDWAERLSDSSDKKSKAYKRARRAVERWSPSERQRAKGAKPTRPKPASRKRLAGAARQADPRLREFRERGAEMRIKVAAMSDSEPGWLPPGRWQTIPREAMRIVVRLWAEGEMEEAAESLYVEFLQQYEVPNVEDWLRDSRIEDLKLRPRPAKPWTHGD